MIIVKPRSNYRFTVILHTRYLASVVSIVVEGQVDGVGVEGVGFLDISKVKVLHETVENAPLENLE
jgi:hypothetical protein